MNIENARSEVDAIIEAHILKTGELPASLEITRGQLAGLFLAGDLETQDLFNMSGEGCRVHSYRGIRVETN